MLPEYLCEFCRRGCQGADKENCLKAPALNLGCGYMIRPEWINFDATDYEVGALRTDILGEIKHLTDIFQPDTFGSITCIAVFEHFYRHEAIQLLKDCYTIIRPKGHLIVEAPDFAKMIRQDVSLNQLIAEVYGDAERTEQIGPAWSHKWGWTGQQAAKAMQDAGFKIRFVGEGWMHNKTFRDFRVEGVKE